MSKSSKIINDILKEYITNIRGIVTKEDFLKIILWVCKQRKKTVWYKDDLIVEIYKFLKRSNHNYIPLTLRSIEYKLYKLAKERRYIAFQNSYLYRNPFFPETSRKIVNVYKSKIERELLNEEKNSNK